MYIYESNVCYCNNFSFWRYHTYHKRLINFHICFCNPKNIVGKLLICRTCVWKSCICRCWTVYSAGRKVEGRLSGLSLSSVCQVHFYYLLNFISDVSFGPFAFRTSNSTLNYAELRYKTSVKISNIKFYSIYIYIYIYYSMYIYIYISSTPKIRLRN